MKKIVLNRKNGFTFIELIISMFIMTVIIAGMSLTLLSLMKASQHNIDQASGYMIANTIMREFILKNKRTISDHVGNSGWIQYQENINVNKHYGVNKPVTKYVYNVDVKSSSGVYVIKVTVKWRQSAAGAEANNRRGEKAALVSTIVHEQIY